MDIFVGDVATTESEELLDKSGYIFGIINKIN